MKIVILAIQLFIGSILPYTAKGDENYSGAPADSCQMALKGKLLLKEDFNSLKEYKKEFQVLQEGWQARVLQAKWNPTAEGIESIWETGHNPVLVYAGLFQDVIIEVDFRFKKEQDPAKNSYCRINLMSRELDPRAYCISTWANANSKGRSSGLVLEHEFWEFGPTGVATQLGTFEPDTWYTMRLEVIGEYAVLSCNGLTAFGSFGKFGLPKNWLTIGVGKGSHELRKLRVYEAIPNPTWIKPDPKAIPYTPLETLAAREPLSPAVVEKIRRMTPLFDRQTLRGWIQAPVAPITIAREDVADPMNVAKRLTAKSDPVSAFISERLDSAARAGMQGLLAGNNDPKQTVSPLVRGINTVLKTDTVLYEKRRFRGITLSRKTQEMLKKNPQGLDRARLNRMLLEDVYSKELTKSPDVSWMVKDSCLVSTGAGRGVIYTEKDYTNYRLVFQVRQSSGNHSPGVLIFCQRPPKGESGLDALGGIQFAVPSGAHWDYRPGINRSGDHFTRPLKIRYNATEWAQVEIYVDGEKGMARMAVAQPVGTRPLEILNFSDSTVVKSGPIALQMHNALLFDEYKDIRIEVDPKEKRLITFQW